MDFLGILLAVLFSAGFALVGRWIQLYPQRIFPDGHFTTERGWQSARRGVAILGTFAVFMGTYGVMFGVFQPLTAMVSYLGLLVTLLGLFAGFYVARYVRREVAARPPHVSKNPYGWWP